MMATDGKTEIHVKDITSKLMMWKELNDASHGAYHLWIRKFVRKVFAVLDYSDVKLVYVGLNVHKTLCLETFFQL